MDATTMPSTKPLIERLQADYPSITFHVSDHFEWQPTERSILYDPTDAHFAPRILHEVSHAELEHSSYARDIELLAMERDAWQRAKVDLAPKYDIAVTADAVQYDMDTYRDWLHARSTCPACNSNGLELKKHSYRCISCAHTWRVNEARTCSLKRYSTKKHP